MRRFVLIGFLSVVLIIIGSILIVSCTRSEYMKVLNVLEDASEYTNETIEEVFNKDYDLRDREIIEEYEPNLFLQRDIHRGFANYDYTYNYNDALFSDVSRYLKMVYEIIKNNEVSDPSEYKDMTFTGVNQFEIEFQDDNALHFIYVDYQGVTTDMYIKYDSFGLFSLNRLHIVYYFSGSNEQHFAEHANYGEFIEGIEFSQYHLDSNNQIEKIVKYDARKDTLTIYDLLQGDLKQITQYEYDEYETIQYLWAIKDMESSKYEVAGFFKGKPYFVYEFRDNNDLVELNYDLGNYEGWYYHFSTIYDESINAYIGQVYNHDNELVEFDQNVYYYKYSNETRYTTFVDKDDLTNGLITLRDYGLNAYNEMIDLDLINERENQYEALLETNVFDDKNLSQLTSDDIIDFVESYIGQRYE